MVAGVVAGVVAVMVVFPWFECGAVADIDVRADEAANRLPS